jgi:hypothetical protein
MLSKILKANKEVPNPKVSTGLFAEKSTQNARKPENTGDFRP